MLKVKFFMRFLKCIVGFLFLIHATSCTGPSVREDYPDPKPSWSTTPI